VSDAEMDHWSARVDLAAALRWTARLGMHDPGTTHFSLALDTGGRRVLMSPARRHFARIRARDLIELDAGDPATMGQPGAPGAGAWGLHGGLHRHCAHARCAMHAHSVHATVLACLSDSRLPPIDRTSAAFYNRHVVDEGYGGFALTDAGARCARQLHDARHTVLVMGNHGVLVIGDTVAETFARLCRFERGAETYIKALHTGKPLRVLSPEAAETAAREAEACAGDAEHQLAELKAVLDAEASDYAT